MKLDEYETHVSLDYAQKLVRIYTTVPAHIRKLALEGRARLVSQDSESATYEVDSKDFNPLGGFKRKNNWTPLQRAAAAERLAKAREEKK